MFASVVTCAVFSWLFACSDGDPAIAPGVVTTEDSSVPQSRGDATTPEDSATSVVEASADAPEDTALPVLKRVSGTIDYNGGIANATVTLLSPTMMTTVTDQSGDFSFFVPEGAAAIMKGEAPPALPMIRGVIAGKYFRSRTFYMAGQAEIDAAQALGKSFDPTKGIVEVDFRNATIGGYSVTLKSGGVTITPGFGMALDDQGNPVLSTATVAGGNGSTLLLADVPPNATLSFSPIMPSDAGPACIPCDADLPVQAGVVTWFDFECGVAGCE